MSEGTEHDLVDALFQGSLTVKGRFDLLGDHLCNSLLKHEPGDAHLSLPRFQLGVVCVFYLFVGLFQFEGCSRSELAVFILSDGAAIVNHYFTSKLLSHSLIYLFQ